MERKNPADGQRVLVLLVLFCGLFTSHLHAVFTDQFNGVPLIVPANRTVSSSEQPCNNVDVSNAMSVVISAAGRISSQALCVMMSEENSTDKVQALNLQLKQMLRSALDLSGELNPQTNLSVAALFSSMDGLTETTIQDLHFVEIWLYLKIVPVLPYLNGQDLEQLSQMNFTCGVYHVIVTVFGDDEAYLTTSQLELIYSNFIYKYLSKTQTEDPGCFSNVTSDSEWLQWNFGIFYTFASLTDLQKLNRNFTSFASLVLLSPSQTAELTVTSGALNNTGMINQVFDHLEKQNAFQNLEEFYTVLNTTEDVKISPAVQDVMMNRTFVIISPYFTNFSLFDWQSWFNVNLKLLLPSFTSQMLQTTLLYVDCAGYEIIVESLSGVFEQMSVVDQQEITVELVNYLLLNYNTDPTCVTNTSSLSVWINLYFGNFSVYVNYSDLETLNPGFSNFSSLDLLSPPQVAELAVKSGAFNNTQMVKSIFTHLKTGDAFQNVQKFLQVLSQNPQNVKISPAVQDVMMNQTFVVISPYFTNFSLSDWQSWFNVNLKLLLPSFTSQMLQTTLLYVDCSGYEIIVEALSSVFDYMSVLNQQDITDVLVSYLIQNYEFDPTCRTNSSSFSVWLNLYFGNFSVYVNFSNVQSLNPEFANFTSLNLLSPSQVAELAVKSGALDNTVLINLIFTRLKTGDAFKNVDQFLSTLAQTSPGLKISPVVRDDMMNQTFSVISPYFANFSRTQWNSWFNVKLTPLLLSFTPQMLQTTTSYVDCIGYQIIVESLSGVFEQMSVVDQQEITVELVNYLLLNYHTDPTCVTNTSSLSVWINLYFGNFSVYVDYSDLETLNPGFSNFSSLNILSPSQVAELAVKSGATNNANLMNLIFTHLKTSDAFQNVKEFLNVLDQNSQSFEISPVVRDVMMNQTFVVISPYFTNFSLSDWQSWFDVNLQLLLPSFTSQMLQTTLLYVDCAGYEIIVQALSNQSDQMTTLTMQEITEVLVSYLKQNSRLDVNCQTNSSSLSAWLSLYFGKFSVYLDFSDIQELNSNFTIFSSLNLFTTSQLAELAVNSGGLENPELIKLIYNRLESKDAFVNVNVFLSTLAQTPQEASPVVRDVMMNQTFSVISPYFGNFSKSQWNTWFNVNLKLLLPSFTPQMLQTTLLYVNCAGYEIIVESLSGVFEQMSVVDQQEITVELVNYLLLNYHTDPTCVTNTSSLSVWINLYFGNFSVYVDYSDLETLNPSFTNFSSLDLLSPPQVAELAVKSGAFNNTQMVKSIFTQLKTGDAFQNVQKFLQVLSQNPQNVKISPAVQDVMMNQTFVVISPYFTNFSLFDWQSWFDVNLKLLLPSFTPQMLQTTLSYVDCAAYEIIVESLSGVFEQMSVVDQQEITVELVNYLLLNYNTDPTCVTNTSSLSVWINLYFGNFSIYVNYSDLETLNPGFSNFSSLDLLSPPQVAELAVKSGAFNNTQMVKSIFTQLKTGDAFQNVQKFLQVLSQNPQNVKISPAVQDVMMNQTFVVISPYFTNFSLFDWQSWFNVNLKLLLPSFTSQMLQTTLSYVDCSGYEIIVQALSSISDQMSVSLQQQLTDVMVEYLMLNSELDPSCQSNSSSLSVWLNIYFGTFSVYLSFNDLQTLNPGFVNFTMLDTMNSSQVAAFAVKSGALANPNLVNLVYDHLENKDAFQNVKGFLSALAKVPQSLEISPVVQEVMMNRTFVVISPYFTNFSLSDWQSWFDVNLYFLLPSFNSKMLQTTLLYVDCAGYEIIVESLSSVFEQMSVVDQQEITVELVNYLLLNYHTDPTCVTNSTSIGVWLNVYLGNFTIYANFTDLQSLNKDLRNFTSLNLLSPSQVADLAVKSGALDNTVLVNLIFTRLKTGDAFKNVKQFFSTLAVSSENVVIDPVTRDVMMNQTFVVISPYFTNFSLSDWQSWFNVNLQLLLPSFTSEMLQTTLLYVDCVGYQIIVGSLSSVVEQLSVLDQQEITEGLVMFLKENYSSGFGCESCINTLSKWLDWYFGSFSLYVLYDDLVSLNSGFTSLDSLDQLDVPQVAALAASSGAFSNLDLISRVFQRLETGNAFQNVKDFFTALGCVSQGLDINPVVRDVMMNQTFAAISVNFADFGRVDWVSWFSVKLTPLLPSLSAQMLQTVTSYLDCLDYQIIVEALSDVSGAVSLEQQQEITWVLVNYLKQNHSSIDSVSWFNTTLKPLLLSLTVEILHTSPNSSCNENQTIVSTLTGVLEQIALSKQPELAAAMTDLVSPSGADPSCEPYASTPGVWLDLNFGTFSIYVDFEDLQTLNTGFTVMTSLGSLNVPQIADLALSSGVFNNLDLTDMVLNRLAEGDAFQNIGTFLATISQSNQTVDISPVVRDMMLNGIFSLIGAQFSGLTVSDWNSWLNVKLAFLLPSFSSDMLQMLLLQADCLRYQVVVEALSSVFEQIPESTQQEMSGALETYLMQNYGSGCASPSSVSLSAWLQLYFGSFSVYVDFGSLKELNAGFNSPNALDLLSPSQVAGFAVSSGAFNSSTLIDSVFDRLQVGNAFQNVQEFFTYLSQTSQVWRISPVVMDVMMSRTLAVIRPYFASFSVSDWVSWFDVLLTPLVPSFTTQMLQTPTCDINCIGNQVMYDAYSSFNSSVSSL